MKSFLEYVAADLLQKYGTNLSRIAVVFPNKRAALFLNEHLARLAGKPLWSPAYITISDLFRSHSQRQVADPIQLVCDLHQCFTQCTGIDESLDHFYGWGQLLKGSSATLTKNIIPNLNSVSFNYGVISSTSIKASTTDSPSKDSPTREPFTAR